MTRAPIPALEKWGPALAIFPPDVAAILGRMASRLTDALGSPAPAPKRRGVPAGYDGIARRGALEHIALSEWALLDVAPDELVRRISQGEMSYLRRAQRAPHGDRATWVLFDVGPDQLGAPRLAHLAILVALAQRAHRRRSRLIFGALQDARTARHEGLHADGVTALLAQRSHVRGRREDLARWHEAFSSAPGAPAEDERFLVGAPFSDPQTVQLGIDEPLDASAELRVTVSSPRAGRREVRLVLPMPRDALRVLRDPFAAPAPSSVTAALVIDPKWPPVLTSDGRRLFFRSGDDTLTQVHVPNSKRANVGPATTLRLGAGHSAIAIGRHKDRLRRTIVVSRSASSLWVHDFSKRGHAETPRALALGPGIELPDDPRSLSVASWRDGGTSWFVSGSALLAVREHTVVARHDVSVVHAVDASVGLSCVCSVPRGGYRHLIAQANGSLTEREIPLQDAVRRHAVWGGSAPFPCAIGVGTTRYDYYGGANSPARSIPVGMTQRCVAANDAGVIVLDRKLTEVSLLRSASERAVLFTTARPVVAVVVSPSNATICAVTAGGELVIYRDPEVVSRQQFTVVP